MSSTLPLVTQGNVGSVRTFLTVFFFLGSSPPFSSCRNYGPTIAVQNEAVKRGCQQVLWLYGEQEEITEVGTMNLFIYWTNQDGGRT